MYCTTSLSDPGDCGEKRMKEYRSRDFCKAMHGKEPCPIQARIDAAKSEKDIEFAKKYCHSICSAYEIHKRIKDAGIKIVYNQPTEPELQDKIDYILGELYPGEAASAFLQWLKHEGYSFMEET